MPSVSHEALVLLFRECPQLGLALLHTATGLALPEGTQVQATAAAFSDLEPAEYRADAVLRLEAADGQLLRLLVIEVQLAPDSDKRFSWPLYAVGLRARLRAPVLLMVVTVDETVARWCSQPISLDDLHSTFQPLVIGPATIPRIIDLDQARAFPELAVLSAAAHGREARAEEIGLAALGACAVLDNHRAALYADIVLAFLGKVARRALEALMEQNHYSFQSDFARKYIAEGRRELVRELLEQRFGALAEGDLNRIRDADSEQLGRWARRVLQAATLAEVFASES